MSPPPSGSSGESPCAPRSPASRRAELPLVDPISSAGSTLPRTGRRARSGGVAAAVVIALFVALSPFVAATTTLSAPYQGSVTRGQTESTSGCAQAHLAPGGFSLHTGLGSLGVLSSRAHTCANLSGGSSVYSTGQASVSVDPLIHVSLPGGHHKVLVRIGATWAASDQLSLGSGCPAAIPFAYAYHYTLRHTTYWYNETGAASYCAVGASEYSYVEILLEDLTNGTYVPLSSGAGCSYFTAGSTDCFAYTVSHDDYNYTTLGWETIDLTTCNLHGCTYTNTSTSLNASYSSPSTSFHGSGHPQIKPGWSYTFVASHQYEFVIYGYSSSGTYSSGWTGGHAVGHLNAGTLGNEIDLSGVTIT